MENRTPPDGAELRFYVRKVNIESAWIDDRARTDGTWFAECHKDDSAFIVAALNAADAREKVGGLV